MKKLMMMIGLACSLVLAACGPMQTGIDPVKATATIDKVEARYVAAKAFAEMLMPFLPAEHQARIVRAQYLIERAIVAARIATTAAEQMAALKQAEKEMETLTDSVPITGISG